MHAVVVKVTIHDFERAQALLHEEVVPRVSSAPGFVAGYWMRPQEGQGLSTIVFESEEAARAAAGMIRSPDDNVVTIESAEVREVLAHA